MSDELKKALEDAVAVLKKDATAALKEYVDDLSDQGKAFVRECLTKLADYTLKAEQATTDADKDKYRHLSRAVISSAASEVSIETSEAKAFLRGLLEMAKSALENLVPALLKGGI